MNLDRSQPPQAREVAPFRFPEIHESSLPGGIRLLALPSRRRPLLRMSIVLGEGGSGDPIADAGRTSLAADLLDQGIGRHGATEVARRAERLGGAVASGADWDSIHLDVESGPESLEAALDLLADLVLAPSFPSTELARLRSHRLADLASRRAQPAALAARALQSTLYPGLAWGAGLIGNESNLERFGRGELRDRFEAIRRTAPAAVLATGGFAPQDLERRLTSRLAGWERLQRPEGTASAGVAVPDIAEPCGPPRVVLVDRPGAAQTELRIGRVGLSADHPRRPAAVVANAVLGGQFTSRLNLCLRERHSLTYGVRSHLSGRRGPGPFVISAAVETSGVGLAVRETLREMERMTDRPVPRDELADTVRYLRGVFPYGLQTASGRLARLEHLAVHQRPTDHWDRYLERLQQTDERAVQEVAGEFLTSAGVVIAACGPASELEPQLAAWGEPIRLEPQQL